MNNQMGMTMRWLLAILCSLLIFVPAAHAQDPYQAARLRMVEQEIAPFGVRNGRVLAALANTPRHQFVGEAEQSKAYFDMALPIGHNQSISSPYIVGVMTERLEPKATDRVLEIGTGSGYQAAILSPLVKDVYSIEIVEPLGRSAAERLKRLGYKNVYTRIGDGYLGWPEAAPFDKIIVTCSPENIPKPLVDQLKVGGRLIVPLGQRLDQTLYLFKKTADKLEREAIEPTMFVPMTGKAEDERAVKQSASEFKIRNPSFEKTIANGQLEGWYYVRQGKVENDSRAPDGKRVIHFRNTTPGRFAQALQAVVVDGAKSPRLAWSFSVRLRKVAAGEGAAQRPHLHLSFYDAAGLPVGEENVGLCEGNLPWTVQAGVVQVPPKTARVLVFVGLLGATGDAWFDNVEIHPHDEAGSAAPTNFDTAK